jgi:alanine racemase
LILSKKVTGLEHFYRPTWVEIDLDALRANVAAFQRALPTDMQLMAVVKANGYGHGAIQIAREAVARGVSYLGVAFLDEALELREAGIETPILVLGYTPPEGVRLAIEQRLTLAVFSDEVLAAIAAEVQPGEQLKIHIKIDTGMGRLGLHDAASAVAFIRRALTIPGALVEGLFTHYACADEADTHYTLAQHERFAHIVETFHADGMRFPLLHAGNSATALQFPQLSYNMLRLGISLYGLYPSSEVNHEQVALQPVMSYKTGIVLLKTLPPGSGVSYGATYVTSAEECVATLPIGYADGFTRLLTGKAHVLVRGQKVPVIGRICMDQCVIKVDDVADVALGDEVVVFGRQGAAQITAEELAHTLGTINYEITCMISHRVPRVYIRDGQVSSVVNPLIGSKTEYFVTK